jgi:hypothetical protein
MGSERAAAGLDAMDPAALAAEPLVAAAEALARARDWVDNGEFAAASQALAEHDALLREALAEGVPPDQHPALETLRVAHAALVEAWTAARDEASRQLGDTQRGAGAARAYLDAARG